MSSAHQRASILKLSILAFQNITDPNSNWIQGPDINLVDESRRVNSEMLREDLQ